MFIYYNRYPWLGSGFQSQKPDLFSTYFWAPHLVFQVAHQMTASVLAPRSFQDLQRESLFQKL